MIKPMSDDMRDRFRNAGVEVDEDTEGVAYTLRAYDPDTPTFSIEVTTEFDTQRVGIARVFVWQLLLLVVQTGGLITNIKTEIPNSMFREVV